MIYTAHANATMSWIRQGQEEEEEEEKMNAELGLESRAELMQLYKEGTTIKELRAARDACRMGGKVCMYKGWMNGIRQGVALGLIFCLKPNINLHRQCSFTRSRMQHTHTRSLQPHPLPTHSSNPRKRKIGSSRKLTTCGSFCRISRFTILRR